MADGLTVLGCLGPVSDRLVYDQEFAREVRSLFESDSPELDFSRHELQVSATVSEDIAAVVAGSQTVQ